MARPCATVQARAPAVASRSKSYGFSLAHGAGGSARPPSPQLAFISKVSDDFSFAIQKRTRPCQLATAAGCSTSELARCNRREKLVRRAQSNTYASTSPAIAVWRRAVASASWSPLHVHAGAT